MECGRCRSRRGLLLGSREHRTGLFAVLADEGGDFLHRRAARNVRLLGGLLDGERVAAGTSAIHDGCSSCAGFVVADTLLGRQGVAVGAHASAPCPLTFTVSLGTRSKSSTGTSSSLASLVSTCSEAALAPLSRRDR